MHIAHSQTSTYKYWRLFDCELDRDRDRDPPKAASVGCVCGWCASERERPKTQLRKCEVLPLVAT